MSQCVYCFRCVRICNEPVPATVGLLIGGAFLYVADQMLPHLHAEFPEEASTEGPKVAWRRSALLMLAMTLHTFRKEWPSA
jgi:zinc transporter ZupT